MTPEELIQRVGALVAANRDQEALDLTSKHMRELAPQMTSEQIVQVAEFAHVAQMAVDLEAWDIAEGRAQAPVESPRPA